MAGYQRPQDDRRLESQTSHAILHEEHFLHSTERHETLSELFRLRRDQCHCRCNGIHEGPQQRKAQKTLRIHTKGLQLSIPSRSYAPATIRRQSAHTLQACRNFLDSPARQYQDGEMYLLDLPHVPFLLQMQRKRKPMPAQLLRHTLSIEHHSCTMNSPPVSCAKVSPMDFDA